MNLTKTMGSGGRHFTQNCEKKIMQFSWLPANRSNSSLDGFYPSENNLIGCYNIFTSPMKKLSSILLINVVGLLILTACTSSNISVPLVTSTALPQSTATTIKTWPTSSSPHDSIIWKNLQVTLAENEITNEFVTEFNITRNPSPGEKFMWVHIQLRNMGAVEMDVPAIEHFSLLYAAAEIKPTYGHRKDHTDFSSLGPILFPDQNVDGWIRFDIPDTAELKDLRFVFLPESSNVGSSFNSPNYPYAEDKPTFVWNCGQ